MSLFGAHIGEFSLYFVVVRVCSCKAGDAKIDEFNFAFVGD